MHYITSFTFDNSSSNHARKIETNFSVRGWGTFLEIISQKMGTLCIELTEISILF